jgi:hypothetical protein
VFVTTQGTAKLVCRSNEERSTDLEMEHHNVLTTERCLFFLCPYPSPPFSPVDESLGSALPGTFRRVQSRGTATRDHSPAPLSKDLRLAVALHVPRNRVDKAPC